MWQLQADKGLRVNESTDGVAELVSRFTGEQKRLYGVVVEGWSVISIQGAVLRWLNKAKTCHHNNTRAKLLSLSSNAQLGMMKKVVRVLVGGWLLESFSVWSSRAARELKERDQYAQERALRMWLRVHISQAWRTWREQYIEEVHAKKQMEKALIRMRNREMAAAWKSWGEFYDEAVAAKGRIKVAVSRLVNSRLAGNSLVNE